MDKRDSWRYIWFTFLNGMAQGLGMALGMTVVLGLFLYILTRMLAQMIDFPIIGYYLKEITQLLDVYLKQGAKLK